MWLLNLPRWEVNPPWKGLWTGLWGAAAKWRRGPTSSLALLSPVASLPLLASTSESIILRIWRHTGLRTMPLDCDLFVPSAGGGSCGQMAWLRIALEGKGCHCEECLQDFLTGRHWSTKCPVPHSMYGGPFGPQDIPFCFFNSLLACLLDLGYESYVVRGHHDLYPGPCLMNK